MFALGASRLIVLVLFGVELFCGVCLDVTDVDFGRVTPLFGVVALPPLLVGRRGLSTADETLEDSSPPDLTPLCGRLGGVVEGRVGALVDDVGLVDDEFTPGLLEGCVEGRLGRLPA